MRLYSVRLLVVAAVGLLFGTFANLSMGQENYDVSFNSTYADRLAALEAEIATLKDNAINVGGGSGCGCAADYKCGCGCPSTYFGYEATILRPYIGSANAGGGNIFGNDYGWGHRFILGYDTGDGIGARLRYWMYNHGHTFNPPNAPNGVNIDMDVIDAEVTLNEQMRNWDILVSGGVRYARAEFTGTFAGLGVGNAYFEGYGPTVSLRATRDVGSRGFYIIGDWRTSLLYGDIRGSLYTPTIDDESALIIEEQLGMGWVSQSGAWNIKGVWETQLWMNDTFADDFNGFGSNLTLSGFTVSATLNF